ncbi:hypothetical protein ACFLQY_00580 [Verrucomicrobiota bacterium]
MEKNKPHNPFSHLIDCLKEDGLATAARKLDFLFREVTWTTNSEFLGAFGMEMQKTKRSYWDRMDDATKEAFSSVAQNIQRIWPDIDL